MDVTCAYPTLKARGCMYYRDYFFAQRLSDMVRDIGPKHQKLRGVSPSIRQTPDRDEHQRTERRTWPFSSSAFSAASSSISVISVPFDVTGEGPTISLLGLIRWA